MCKLSEGMGFETLRNVQACRSPLVLYYAAAGAAGSSDPPSVHGLAIIINVCSFKLSVVRSYLLPGK